MAKVSEPDFDSVCGCVCCEECPLEEFAHGCIENGRPCPTNMEDYEEACRIADTLAAAP